MKQTLNTRMLTSGRRGGGVLSGERSGGGSHWGEWRGARALWHEREGDGSLSGGAGRENSETVAKR